MAFLDDCRALFSGERTTTKITTTTVTETTTHKIKIGGQIKGPVSVLNSGKFPFTLPNQKPAPKLPAPASGKKSPLAH